MNPPPISTIEFTVRYAETDQMGVVYHANYLIWCDMARTEHLAGVGISYRALEEDGSHLAVIDAHVRYRAAARFEDRIRVECWARDIRSRSLEFGYVLTCTNSATRLATARATLIALDSNHVRTTIPNRVRAARVPIDDPVRF